MTARRGRPSGAHHRWRCRGASDRGAATVLTVAMAGVLLLAGAAGGVVGALVVDHRTAQAAADLAALAAASASAAGDPCVRAAAIAADNGARLRACRREGLDVVVAVVVTGPRWLGQHGDLVASARAGPAPG